MQCRKYNRGRITGRRQAWILGGVCRETQELFLVECKKRDRATLERIIFDNIALGSHILTDGWKAYQHLGSDSKYRCFFKLPTNEFMRRRSWLHLGLRQPQCGVCFVSSFKIHDFWKYCICRSTNPSVHTQRIESNWWRVKVQHINMAYFLKCNLLFI